MVIKKFIAESLPEALTKVKRDFGDEAVILKTRFSNKGGSGQNSKIVEVTAAIDNNSVKTGRFNSQPASGSEARRSNGDGKRNRINNSPSVKAVKAPEEEEKSKTALREPVNRIANLEAKPGEVRESSKRDTLKDLESKPLPSEILAEIKEELNRLRGELNQFSKGGENPDSYQKRDDQLIGEIRKELTRFRQQNEKSVFGEPKPAILEYIRILAGMHVPEEIAIEIAKKIPAKIVSNNNPEISLNSLVEIISGLIGSGEPVKMVESGPTVVMLVGPTGSGKSSAAARLAFKYSLEEKCPVSLVTTDTFRADSKEQLASHANVIGCSFASVSSPQELSIHVKTIKDGLVIIDTSGVACRQDMEELASMVSAANPHEVHLVAPADITCGDLIDIIHNYPEIGINKVLVSKLDQTFYRGGIIGTAVKMGLKFSYESSSRELPGKFGLFNPVTFVSAIKNIREKIYPVRD